MSSGDFKTCKFGHHIENYHEDIEFEDEENQVEESKTLKEHIEEGIIDHIDQIESIDALTGEYYKAAKVKAKSQGTPRAAALDAADKFDNDLEYEVKKVSERFYVSPQSNLHGEYMQRKQNAEQNIQQTMQSLSRLKKEKHMIEHDIRKLRTRVENMRTGNESAIKGDFVQLVDGANAGGGGGGADEQAMRFLRDNNIYPTIVADFNEMDSLDDLKKEEDGGTGKLAELPRNEKAILKKKYTMYEKWKDLYGSEIQRKLKELKSELKRVERAIDETENWLEPYVRDMVMINEGDLDDYIGDMSKYYHIDGTSTMSRHMKFICRRGLKNHEGHLEVVDDLEEATHFRVVVINVFHLNLANWENPQSPNGTSVAKIMWHPMIVCRHVFDNFFQPLIDRKENMVRNIVDEYTGGFDRSKGEEVREARMDKDLQVREVREKVEEKTGEDIPLEFSSILRRVEDGIDDPEKIEEEFGEEALEALKDILDLDLGEEGDGEGDSEMYKGLTRKRKAFTGQVDESVLPETAKPMKDLKYELKFDYYYDWKLGLGMYTMK